MKMLKINPADIRLTPTERKMRRAKAFAAKISEKSGLPKEAPVERKFYIRTAADKLDQIKNKIQLTVERLTSGK